MPDKTCSGWPSWETFIVASWFDDEWTLNGSPKEIRERVEQFAEDSFSRGLSGFMADVVSGFMADVSWEHLSQAYKTEEEEL